MKIEKKPGPSKPFDDPGGRDGWVPLLNGRDLTGCSAWDRNGLSSKSNFDQIWSVRDGVLHGSGGPSHLFSPRFDYRNFRLRAEIKINDGGNSGLYFRAAKEAGYPKGHEAQIDSTHRDLIKTGSLDGLVNIDQSIVPPETWFTLEVEAVGERIRIWVDGKSQVDYSDPKKAGRVRNPLHRVDVLAYPDAESQLLALGPRYVVGGGPWTTSLASAA